MSDDRSPATTLAPDEAFETLGNGTRLRILQTLGAADGPLSFSTLRERVGMADSGGFNYHLDQLVGHFVRKTDAGYELSRAGGRVVEAVLSGAVTDSPVVDPTEVDHPCHFCGAPIEVAFREERVELYCTECPGSYAASKDDDSETEGYLGYHPLPPAGVEGRTPLELLQVSFAWGHLELVAASHGICPRCSAPLDRETRVCEDHDAGDEQLCGTCGRRYAVGLDLRCTNCIYHEGGAAIVGLIGTTPLLAFVTARGVNPIHPTVADLDAATRATNDYEETVLSTDPLRVRLAVSLDGDELAMTVDDDLQIVDVERRPVDAHSD